MSNYRNILLAGTAALGLIAGADMASAQMQHGASQGNQQQTAQPNTGGGTGGQTQPGSMSGAQSETPGMQQQNAQGEQHGPSPKGARHGSQQNAQGGAPAHPSQGGAPANPSMTQNGGNNGNAQGVNGNNGPHQPGATANSGRGRRGRQTTEERRHVPKGQQGNASGQTQHGNQMQGNNAGQQGVQTGAGTNVRFSRDQRTRIRQTIIDARNAPRAGRVNFDVRIGTAIPRTEINTIHVIPVPEYLVRIEPRWRGLEYFVFRDAVVIVDPRDMRIIAVVPA